MTWDEAILTVITAVMVVYAVTCVIYFWANRRQPKRDDAPITGPWTVPLPWQDRPHDRGRRTIGDDPPGGR